MIFAAADLNTTPLAWENNLCVISNALKEAISFGADLLCFPELCISGYGCEDAFLLPHTCEKSLESLCKLIPFSKEIAFSLGLPLKVEGKLFDSLAFVADGRVIKITCKRILANYGVHYESRWFSTWDREKEVEVEISGSKVPIGGSILEWRGKKIGFEICEEAWSGNHRPALALIEDGVDIVLSGNASHYEPGKRKRRHQLIEEEMPNWPGVYLYSNLLGNEGGRIIYDGGSFISRGGKIVAECKPFSFRDFSLCFFDEEKAKEIEDDKFKPILYSPFEEFSRAASLGLGDYVRKSKTEGFVVSLSGGMDSASTALICRLFFDYGVRELGWEEFSAKFFPALEKVDFFCILTCLYQKTRQNSDETQRAARNLAKALGGKFFSLSIDDIVDSYHKRAEEVFKCELTWESNDKALQNIQARARSVMAWLCANVNNALLLATNNRSELSVGYATMDGDMSGGVAPISGISKTFLQAWLAWLIRENSLGEAVSEILKEILSRPPSAELRPELQTDEKDLMPYEILDTLNQMTWTDKRPSGVWKEDFLDRFANKYSREDLLLWIYKYEFLWKTSQWKRDRSAPGFHLDAYSLDSRSWLRHPIFSF